MSHMPPVTEEQQFTCALMANTNDVTYCQQLHTVQAGGGGAAAIALSWCCCYWRHTACKCTRQQQQQLNSNIISRVKPLQTTLYGQGGLQLLERSNIVVLLPHGHVSVTASLLLQQ